MYLTPEIYGGPHTPPSDGYYTSHATSSQDGTSVMDDASLFNYHARNLLLWSHWVMGFLPERLKVEIDAEKFLGAFSYTSQAGETVATYPWKMAPFPSVISPYGDKHVDTQKVRLTSMSVACGVGWGCEKSAVARISARSSVGRRVIGCTLASGTLGGHTG